MANGYLAGELGAEAEREGPRAMLELGLTALTIAFGSDIVKQIARIGLLDLAIGVVDSGRVRSGAAGEGAPA